MRQVNPTVVPALIAAVSALAGIVIGWVLREASEGLRRRRERRREQSAARRLRALTIVRHALTMVSTTQAVMFAEKARKSGIATSSSMAKEQVAEFNVAVSELQYLLQEVRLLGPDYIEERVATLEAITHQLTKLATKANLVGLEAADRAALEGHIASAEAASRAIVAGVSKHEGQ